MLITVPASAAGEAGATSVLDLDPLIAFARACRPDAVSLMPPPGPDDLPNAAALLTMRNRLEAEGLLVAGGCWTVPADAPVRDEAWVTRTLFEARALVAALGDAGVSPLTVWWRPEAPDGPDRDAMHAWVGRVLEEADRSHVRIALRVDGPDAAGGGILRALPSTRLGICRTVTDARAAAGEVPALGAGLFAVRTEGPLPGGETGAAGGDWRALVAALRRAAFNGPLLLEGCQSPVEYAHAVGFVRGVAVSP